jgi:DNA-binding transcriptional regulator YiaG
VERSANLPGLVRALREHHGLTQEQFAQRLGVSFSTVNVWENGRRAPLPFLRTRLLEMALEAGLTGARTTAAPVIRRKR